MPIRTLNVGRNRFLPFDTPVGDLQERSFWPSYTGSAYTASRTGNIRAVELLIGHTKIEGIWAPAPLTISGQVESENYPQRGADINADDLRAR